MKKEEQDCEVSSTSQQEDEKLFWMAVMPIGILMNDAMGLVTLYAKLPLYLDNMGTILVTILVGVRAGIITAIISSFLGGLLINPMYPYYTGAHIAITLFAGLMAKKGFFRTIPRTLVTGILMGFVGAASNAPLVILFGGFTGTCTDVTTALLVACGKSLFTSAFIANVANDPFDKIIQCCVVVWLIRGFPKSVKAQFANSGYLMRNVLK